MPGSDLANTAIGGRWSAPDLNEKAAEIAQGGLNWSVWMDSNHRPLGSRPRTLTMLSYSQRARETLDLTRAKNLERTPATRVLWRKERCRGPAGRHMDGISTSTNEGDLTAYAVRI